MLYKNQELEEFEGSGEDISGKIFGEWYVICRAPNKKNHPHVWCECSCGSIVSVNSSNLRLKTSSKCHKCAMIECRGKIKKFHGDIPLTRWAGIKKVANQTNRKFEITIEEAQILFLKQNKKCALSGIPIYFNTAHRVDKRGYKCGWKSTASLDRIDSDKDYTLDNCQWVHKDVNIMKNKYDQGYFIDLCTKIVKTKGRSNG